jgi:hypothetical protein
MKYAEKLVSALKGVTDGPVLYDVKGMVHLGKLALLIHILIFF